ncbi:serine/threonine kinase [Fragilaria crotonensis]|nr:serine/threonine kinase [Fragilaria crotonensis]
MTDLYFQTLRSRPRALLQSTGLGVDVTQKEHGSKALILASNNGNEKVVRLLLNDEEVDVNFQDNDGATALYYASHNGQVEVVRALLEHDRVNVNIQDNDGDTALLLASEKGHLEVVRALLNHDGVDVNLPDMDGKTALIVASEFGHFEVVCALLNHEGVNVNIQDNDARTALIWARRKGHSEVVRALLNQEGVDVNVRDKYGYTALKVARMRPEDCAAHLLEENMKRVKLLEENNPAGTGANHLEPRYPPRRNENSSSNDDTKVEEQQKHREEEERKLRKVETSWASFKVVSDKDAKFEPDRSKLLHVMNTPSADPAELSLEYIERCIKKNHKLGSGGYGDGFLAEDSCLPKKFAVKMIRTNTKCNEADIKEMRRCFQMELSILKRFRHPNIIVFYGYSLTANSTQQCLVYEYAANGSLAGFFTEKWQERPIVFRYSIVHHV